MLKLFDGMSKEEKTIAKSILEKIGIEFPTKGVKTRLSIEPHYLVVEQTCTLCKSIHKQYFMMKESEDSWDLKGYNLAEIPPGKDSILRRSNISACQSCKDVLQGWSKDDLIKVLIERSIFKPYHFETL
jgi:hypothetical protein